MKLLECDAYWISPSGNIIPVLENHMKYVSSHPEKFNLTTLKIKSLYRKYKEPLGLEGKAREQILINILQQGWIRVRLVNRPEYWSIQTYTWNTKIKNNIWNWMIDAIDSDIISKYTDLKIGILKSQQLISVSVDDFLNDKDVLVEVNNTKKIKLKEILKEIFNEIDNKNNLLLEKGGYNRIIRILRGFVPSISTIGIITAENPNGKLASPEENKKYNKDLERTLSNGLYGFSKIKGNYGGLTEHSYLIRNITRERLIELGKNYNQESVIFAYRDTHKKYDGFIFEYITVDNKTVESERKMFISSLKNAENYSEYRGRNFIIPFFDDEYAEVEFQKNGGVFTKTISEIKKINPHILKEIKDIEKKLKQKNMSGSYYYRYKGRLHNLLNKINET